MYACAANESERTAIHEVLFGSAMDAIDRFLPDKDKHAVLRGMLAFLAINSTYRGPYTPGSATCLAFALAVPNDGAAMMTKLEGGIGALGQHLHELFVSHGGEIRYRAKVEKILVENDRVTGVRLQGWLRNQRAGRRFQPVARPDPHRPGRRRTPARRPRHPAQRARPSGVVRPDPLRTRRLAGIRPAVRLPQRPWHAIVHRHFRLTRGTATPMGGVQAGRRSRQPVDGHADSVRPRPRAWRPRASTRRARSPTRSRSKPAATSMASSRT